MLATRLAAWLVLALPLHTHANCVSYGPFSCKSPSYSTPTTCVLCLAGYYCPGGPGAPICSCPPGTYCNILCHANCITWSQCPVGQGILTLGTPTSDVQCIPCASPCAPGYRAVNTSTPGCAYCVPACPANAYVNNSTGICSQCPANSSSPQASYSVFQCACAPWFKANDTATTRACVACPVCSQYQIRAPVNNTFCGYVCQDCSRGYYKSAQANLCLPCTPGTFSNGSALACTPCPAGSVAPLYASPDCSVCTQGTAAYRQDSPCVACNASQYVPAHPAELA